MGLTALTATSGITGVFLVMFFLQLIVHLSSALASVFEKKDKPAG